MKVKNIVSISLFTAAFILCSFTTLEQSSLSDKIDVVVIDAGHGGKDPGCEGTYAQEADVALQIALELGEIIKENMPGVKVIFTRDKDNFVELHDRAGIANKNGADLFISIHCNSGPTSAYGTETFVMGLHKATHNLNVEKRENAVILMEENHEDNYEGYDPNGNPDINHIIMSTNQYAHMDQSTKLAGLIEDQFEKRVQRRSRGVKQAGLLVLWKTAMPSVLVEVGFLTNKDEEKYLTDDLGQTYMASAIYRAFRDYKNEIESTN